MNSIFIDAREWHDKTSGSTYFSARVEVDGREVARLPFQYGYESYFEQKAFEILKNLGLVSPEIATWYELKQTGVSVYTHKNTALLREVKAWGAN